MEINKEEDREIDKLRSLNPNLTYNQAKRLMLESTEQKRL